MKLTPMEPSDLEDAPLHNAHSQIVLVARPKIKLLHVVTSMNPERGGVAESIRVRSLHLVALGHIVEIVSLDSADDPFLRESGLNVIALGPGFSNWQYSRSLRTWLLENISRFDAVVVDGIWQAHGIITRAAARRVGIPYFVFPHGMLDPWFSERRPLKHLKKQLIWRWVEYRVLRDAEAVLFACEQERLSARNSFWPYQLREEVVPLGASPAPTNTATCRDKFFTFFPELSGRKYILFLGRLHPKKGCDILLDAFARLALSFSEIDLVFAGPGSESFVRDLKDRAKALSVDSRVHWTGMIEGDIKWGAFFAASVFALPSHQENFGVAVVEAMFAGKPVLISNKVNIWREIAAAGAGFVDEDTLDGTIACLNQWANSDPSCLGLMSKSAFALAHEKFSPNAMSLGLLNMIQGHPSASAGHK